METFLEIISYAIAILIAIGAGVSAFIETFRLVRKKKKAKKTSQKK